MRVNESAGYLEYYLDYIDYTSEDKEWVQVFEKNPKSSKKNSKESIQLMIRPSFPQWCYGHEVPEQFPNSVVTAIVDEAWKVGDLVDWLNEGCYWSGKITKLLDEDRVEVKLLAPPIGEGKRYPANRNDLRPTLEWSLINGWTVPLSQANKKSWHVAHLLRHSKSESEKSTSYEELLSDDEYGDNSGGVQLSRCTASTTSQGGPVALAPPSARDSASSPKAQKDGNLPSAENLKPNSPDPSHGTQSAATSRQPYGILATGNQELGTGISSKQEQNWSLVEAEADGNGQDEFLEKLDTLEAKLNHHIQHTHMEQKP